MSDKTQRKIEIYVKTGCPWCNGVLEYFRENSIEHEVKNVTESRELYDEMVELSGQTKAPVVVIDGHMIADTDREAVAKYLEDNPVHGA